MLGAKTSPENPSSNQFPNISVFTEEDSEAQQVGDTFCNHMLVATLFTYSEVLSSGGFISALVTALQTSPAWPAGGLTAKRAAPRKMETQRGFHIGFGYSPSDISRMAGRWFDGEACSAQKDGNATF